MRPGTDRDAAGGAMRRFIRLLVLSAGSRVPGENVEKSVAGWDDTYPEGAHLRRWDYRHPTPKLVGVLATGTVPIGGWSVEIGCGARRDAIFLAHQGFQSVGIGLSWEALAIARERARESKVGSTGGGQTWSPTIPLVGLSNLGASIA